MKQPVIEHWNYAADWNMSIDPSTLPCSDSNHYSFLMDCRKPEHAVLKTCQAIYRFYPRGVRCKHCKPPKSDLEHAIRSVLDKWFDGRYRVEEKMLKGKHGPVDFRLVDSGLLIEGDGSQHIKKAMYGTTLDAQSEIDNVKDERALDLKQRVLRIHFMDEPYISYWVGRALSLCAALNRTNNDRGFIMFSTKYNRDVRWV